MQCVLYCLISMFLKYYLYQVVSTKPTLYICNRTQAITQAIVSSQEDRVKITSQDNALCNIMAYILPYIYSHMFVKKLNYIPVYVYILIKTTVIAYIAESSILSYMLTWTHLEGAMWCLWSLNHKITLAVTVLSVNKCRCHQRE